MSESRRPVQHRRRGQTLEDDILDAAWSELLESGWQGLQMARVAARARTGKSSVYNRWPTKADLVRAAAVRAAGTLGPGELTGSLPEVLRQFLAHVADRLESGYGEALRGLAASAAAHRAPSTAAFTDDSPIRYLVDVTRAAQASGELRRGVIGHRTLNLGVTLVNYHYLVHGRSPGDEVLDELTALWVAALVHLRDEPEPRNL